MKIIKRIALDKISSFDEIINKLLKICVLIMMQLLTSLFIVCIQQTYHSKGFKKFNIITLKKVDKQDNTISNTYRSITLLNIIEKISKFIMSREDLVNKRKFIDYFSTRSWNVERIDQLKSFWNFSSNKFTLYENKKRIEESFCWI